MGLSVQDLVVEAWKRREETYLWPWGIAKVGGDRKNRSQGTRNER